jgi:molybdate transport system substrate-binding protein
LLKVEDNMVFTKLIAGSVLACVSFAAMAGEATIVAAADLKFAMDEIVKSYKQAHADDELKVIYGSSGKFFTQIENDAPYDLFFSADIRFPEKLVSAGKAVGIPKLYAIGRIVLWSNSMDASQLNLNNVTDSAIRKFAIASPDHAPYGARAKEALISAGIWDNMRPKIVNGENIGHTTQMIESGAADAGIIALSLALSPKIKGSAHPHYTLIDDRLHEPLEQAYVLTKRAQDNETAKRFARYMESQQVRSIMDAYGFVLPSNNR